jgi:hypothetical protein
MSHQHPEKKPYLENIQYKKELAEWLKPAQQA